MYYTTVRAKRICNYLFDDQGNFHRIYNPRFCEYQGYYLLKPYKLGYVVLRNIYDRVVFDEDIQSMYKDFERDFFKH